MSLAARVLTARGRGAVAVIELRGPGAVGAIDAILAESGQPPIGLRQDRPRLRRIGGEEVVVVSGAADPSGVEVVELHCHGGTAIVDWVLDHLRGRGASVGMGRRWEDPSRSVIRAQASALLPFAPTIRTAEALLSQEAGALDREIGAIVAELSDHEEKAAERLRLLIGRSALGLRLVSGHTVVLSGPPNVGKSALFNAIVGFDRAIVSPRAGTTRDALRARLALRGWPIEWIDTAGLHEAGDPLDRQGVHRGRATASAADLVLRVVDLSEPFAQPERSWGDERSLLVASKADLAPRWDARGEGAIAVSSATGAGLPALIDAILDRLGITSAALEGPLAFRPSQVRHVDRALRGLECGEPAKAKRILSGLLAPWPRR